MKKGSNWPRAEYVSADANFPSIASMLMGMDFFYQADLVAALKAEEPDVDEICKLFAKSRESIDGFHDILTHFVLYDNEILELWNKRRDEAANSGTWMHAMLERVFNGYLVQPGSMSPELYMAVNLISEINDVQAYRTEWCIYAEAEDLAGSIDLVLKKTGVAEFVLVDWKRSEKLAQKYNGYGKLMKHPLHSIEDCQGQHYRLQLNIYKWILEKYYDLVISEMYVVCVHPVYDPDGFVDVVPDMTEQVEELMQCRRTQILARKMEANTAGVKHALDQVEAAGISPAVPSTNNADVQDAEIASTTSFQVQDAENENAFETSFKHDLEGVLDEMDAETPAAAKRRRLAPGAATHAQDFKDFFTESDNQIASVLHTYESDFLAKPDVILLKTRGLVSRVKRDFAEISLDLQRLIVVAGYISEGHIGPTVMVADAAAIFWMVEGERHVRVHNGFLYIYDADGSFLTFKGIPPEAVLSRIKNFFTILEGIFKRMKLNVPRDNVSVAKAIVTDSQNFPDEDCFFHTCRAATRETAAVQSDEVRLDAEGNEYSVTDDKKKHQAWNLGLADLCRKLSNILRRELMTTRMIALLVEWCETDDMRQPAICYDDICFLYDLPDARSPITVVRKNILNNCYVRVPHPLLDPVCAANEARLKKFYEQTFWCNLNVFRCFQSAIALAKRGLNIDRCFIGISPGGVGQSLYSLHLAEMYKQNHAFFDPRVWVLDEELRKQVESFANCFILTGQEAPESNKKIQTDLYKKFISGDGIMGRKPYGYSTRMFRVIGWTRLEVNRMIAFQGVTLKNLHSIFRRALVWKGKARFVHPKFLLRYPDHELDGIFAADPSLAHFFTQTQASCAGLKLQWAFEERYNKDMCYEEIEAYCNGGDQYLTEDAIRQACSIPIRNRQHEPDDGLQAVLAAEEESQKDMEKQVNDWDNLRELFMVKLLESSSDSMTFYAFKNMTLSGNSPNLSRDKMWDELEDRGLVRRSICRGKTTKTKPGTFIPKISFSTTLHEICGREDMKEQRMVFEEQHDLQRLRQYAFGHTERKTNIQTLLQYYMQAKKSVESKAGRKTYKQNAFLKNCQNAQVKLEAHERAIDASLAGRRITGKNSVQLETPELSEAITVTKQIKYFYSPEATYSVNSRRYAGSGSAQSMSRRLQLHVLDGHTCDLDIQNCSLTLLHQLIVKLDPKPAMPDELAALLHSLAHNRSDFISKIGTSMVDGKKTISELLHGGSLPDALQHNADVLRLRKLSIYLRWVACNLLYDDYISLKDNKAKPFPEASIFSLMWQSIENYILHVWTEHILESASPPAHLSLHFDGVRISEKHIQDVGHYTELCEKKIKERTSFEVKIVQKKLHHFITLATQKASEVSTVDALPDALTLPGNCVPCALWHMAPLARNCIISSVNNSQLQENIQAMKDKARSYRSSQKLCKADLLCCVGLPENSVKSFILHYEGTGSPHCVNVQISQTGESVTIFNGSTKMKMTIQDFREACASAVDRSTFVSFWRKKAKDTLSEWSAVLLDIVAGAEAGPADSDASEDSMLPLPARARYEFDSDGCPYVTDNVLQTLQKEVEQVLQSPMTTTERSDGKRRCPFCPFRGFKQVKQLRVHLAKHHTKKTQFVASGTKQVKVIMALYDDAASSQSDCSALLRRSAQIMRRTVVPPLPANVNDMDRRIRLVYDASGPTFMNLTAIGSSVHVRRARNVYYTHSFADLLLREMILSHAQVSWIALLFFLMS